MTNSEHRTSDPTRRESRISLLAAEPDIGRYLDVVEREEARQVTLPVRELRPGLLDLRGVFERSSIFAAVVLDGLMVQRLRISDHVALRLLGPGDLISLTERPLPTLLSETEAPFGSSVHVALLGPEMRSAVGRWPALLDGLHTRMAEQSDRLSAQLVICQLPRVEDRVLTMLWLLAETWGRVGKAGTTLPVSLTHDVLGGLVGARRSTVTLALGELTERGALIKRDRGWLLVHEPPPPSSELEELAPPRVLDADTSGWNPQDHRTRVAAVDTSEMADTLRRLHEEHVRTQELVRDQLARVRRSLEQRAALRSQYGGSALDRLHHHDRS